MKPRLIASCCAVLLAAASTPVFAGGPITCKLAFNLSGWSIFYKTASGTGTVSPRMVVEVSRWSTSISTRWRSLSFSKSARFARRVSCG